MSRARPHPSRADARLPPAAAPVSPADAAAGRAAQAGAAPVLRVGVLAVEGNLLSSLASAGDMLRVAQTLAQIRDPLRAPRFECVWISARGATRIALANGLELSGLVPVPDKLDVLIIPGLMHNSALDLATRIAQLQPEIELLRRLHLQGVRLAGTCSGTFLLAESGLLDGRRATTSWWLSAMFRQRYPQVLLDEAELFVDAGELLSAGAACAAQSLVLRLIAQAGGEDLAQQTARMLLVDPDRHSQAPYVNRALIERPRHSMSEKAEHFLQQELHEDLSVSRLAEHCGTSERSLLRHFRSHYGVSPMEHIQHLRVERAKALLEASHLSFEEIVERCGYSDVSSFRKLFKRATTMTPMDYRDRFRLRPH
jgi:transcriptional regulator GlxA family with amidase domain